MIDLPSPSPPSGIQLPRPPSGADGVALGPFRFLPKARKTVGDSLAAAYYGGYADGLATGQTVGYAGGHVAGILEGSGALAIVFGLILFAVLSTLSRFVVVSRK